MLVSIRKTLVQCERNEGIPDAIEVDPQEAASIVWEVNRLHREGVKVQDSLSPHVWKNPLDVITFSKAERSSPIVNVSPMFVLFGKTRPSLERVKEFLKQWFRGDYEVIYHYRKYDVPIVIRETKEEQPSS